MRRVVALLLTLVLAFSLAACGRAGTVGSASGGHHLVGGPTPDCRPPMTGRQRTPGDAARAPSSGWARAIGPPRASSAQSSGHGARRALPQPRARRGPQPARLPGASTISPTQSRDADTPRHKPTLAGRRWRELTASERRRDPSVADNERRGGHRVQRRRESSPRSSGRQPRPSGSWTPASLARAWACRSTTLEQQNGSEIVSLTRQRATLGSGKDGPSQGL